MSTLRRRNLEQESAARAEYLEEQRSRDRDRLEKGLRDRFMCAPGATPEAWEKEKGTILAEARKAEALGGEDTAKERQGRMLKGPMGF